ncbi:hypothetical protein EDB80DRAFT_454594 [Ilyonectria destructans]|nr:hypothetical protein EDB80DRAFT_454594 [Ilyonectria destructans]
MNAIALIPARFWERELVTKTPLPRRLTSWCTPHRCQRRIHRRRQPMIHRRRQPMIPRRCLSMITRQCLPRIQHHHRARIQHFAPLLQVNTARTAAYLVRAAVPRHCCPKCPRKTAKNMKSPKNIAKISTARAGRKHHSARTNAAVATWFLDVTTTSDMWRNARKMQLCHSGVSRDTMRCLNGIIWIIWRIWRDAERNVVAHQRREGN